MPPYCYLTRDGRDQSLQCELFIIRYQYLKAVRAFPDRKDDGSSALFLFADTVLDRIFHQGLYGQSRKCKIRCFYMVLYVQIPAESINAASIIATCLMYVLNTS